jgi:glutamyl-tRNA synthetase
VPAGRFAPSPTGSLHLGNLRTALLAWLFARSDHAPFLLRVEDLDPVASRLEHGRQHVTDLTAVGIDWDGAPLRQSRSRAEHDAALARLEALGLVYPCFCTRREVAEALAAPHGPQLEGAYPGTCRALTDDERQAHAAAGRRAALRVRAAGAEVSFDDRLHGSCAGVVDDFVVRRADGLVAYQLAVVVDDAAQDVGEVVRGDDILDSTPRQVWLQQVLGLPTPSYAHVPLVLGADGERLAKRHGAVTLADLARRGVDPPAVRALLAESLGLAAPGEPVTPGQMLARFDPTRVPHEPWTFTAPGDHE